MNAKELSDYFRAIGAKGGAKSKRKLSPRQARAMQRKSAAARVKKAKARETQAPT